MSDLKNAGAVIDAASRAGANSIDSVSFILRQTSPARGQALADATQQAMNKARSIAQSLGGRVLRVAAENEGATVTAEPQAYNMVAGESYKANKITPPPLTAGQLSIWAHVQLMH